MLILLYAWFTGLLVCSIACVAAIEPRGGSKNERAMTQLDLRPYITIVRGRLLSIYKASVGA
jgi:hypothetical protein